MRKILFALLLLPFIGSSQVKQLYNQYGGVWKRLVPTVGFRLPMNDSSTKDGGVASFDSAQVYYNPADSSVYYYTGFQWLKAGGATYTANLPIRITGTVISLDTSFAYNPSVVTNLRLQKIVDSIGGNPYRFGKSGEDATAAENRSFDLTSTYAYVVTHALVATIIADTSAGVGRASLSLAKANNSAFLGTQWKSTGAGHNAAYFRSNWNSGNVFAELASSPTSNTATESYFRAYSDSLSTWLQPSVTYKIHNLPSGAGTRSIRYDPSNGEITYADTTGGSSGTNNANVGSGYRWLKPGTQEVKTLFGGYGILSDSSSNTDGITLKADTVNIATKAAVDKFRDSLVAAGWGALTSVTNSEPWYKMFDEMNVDFNMLFQQQLGGTGSTSTRMNFGTFTPPGWVFGVSMGTGTTSGGKSLLYCPISSGNTYAAISVVSTARFNFGTKVRLEDLSNGTDTYEVHAGVSDDANLISAFTKGIYFSYTDGVSSGQWVATCEQSNTRTDVATGVTVAADTDYTLEFSAFGSEVKFYINKSLVATISTNIPTSTDLVSPSITIYKTAGTTDRVMYCDWGAVGTKSN